MALSDFTSAVCVPDDPKQKLWQDHIQSCDNSIADVQALIFNVEGADPIDCWTDATVLQTAIDNKTLKVLVGSMTGGIGGTTDQETDTSAYACMPPSVRTDATTSFNFNYLFRPEDYEFWKQFSNDSTAANQFAWVNKSGVLFVAQGTPTVVVNQSIDNNLDIYAGVVTWTGTVPPKPYKGMASVFRCK